MITYGKRREECQHLVTPDAERRPANALNVECGSPSERCRLKPPPNWRGHPSVARWLASGGSPLVLGECNENCPGEREEIQGGLYEALSEAHQRLKEACVEIADLDGRESFIRSLNDLIGRVYIALRNAERGTP